MRILIFGASGSTGQELVVEGLREGQNITAFVRNPNAISIKNDRLTIFKGDILNATQVAEALKGQDAVISVLGNKTSIAIWRPNTTISDGLRNIIPAMKKAGVKRLLFVTSFGVSNNIFFLEKLFIKIFLKNIFADIPEQERLIENSDLDWTIVRPARLVNNLKTTKYKAGENLRLGIFSKISRADVADFLLKSLNEKESFGKIITVSY